jgi:hypothetical protein
MLAGCILDGQFRLSRGPRSVSSPIRGQQEGPPLSVRGSGEARTQVDVSFLVDCGSTNCIWVGGEHESNRCPLASDLAAGTPAQRTGVPLA